MFIKKKEKTGYTYNFSIFSLLDSKKEARILVDMSKYGSVSPQILEGYNKKR